jgi:hypothetical protein
MMAARTYLTIKNYAEIGSEKTVDLSFDGRKKAKIELPNKSGKNMTYFIPRQIKWGPPGAKNWDPNPYPAMVIKELPENKSKVTFLGWLPGKSRGWDVQETSIPRDDSLASKMAAMDLMVKIVPLDDAAK